MKEKIKTPVIIAIIAVIATLAFYGGITYGKFKKESFNNPGKFGQNGIMLQRSAENGQGMRRGQGMNIAGGEIISKDEKSLTVKLQDGGSKIIFLSASTTVSKTIDASLEELTVGTNISANGQANSDGSVNAFNIQIRPLIPAPKN